MEGGKEPVERLWERVEAVSPASPERCQVVDEQRGKPDCRGERKGELIVY